MGETMTERDAAAASSADAETKATGDPNPPRASEDPAAKDPVPQGDGSARFPGEGVGGVASRLAPSEVPSGSRAQEQPEKISKSVGEIRAQDLASVLAHLGLRARATVPDVPGVIVPALPAEFAPDAAYLVARSGVHVVRYDLLGDVELDMDDVALAIRYALWGLRHGMKLPDAVTSAGVVRSDLCPACGARPHNQDHRLADPAVERLLLEAGFSGSGKAAG